jgi:hypothetical protein
MAHAWRKGLLRYLMTRTQSDAYDKILALAGTVFVLRCTRRFGKTLMLALLCWMQALKRPGSIIRYVAPSKLAGRQFVIPAFDWVAKRAPASLRPRFRVQDNAWVWPNGSVCHLGSAETMDDVEKQVGTECHFAAIDEAGKYRAGLLTHLIRSVLRPQFLTTGGKMVIASTPPISRAHDFTAWVADAMERGALATYTIDDIDHISAEEKASAIAELGGPDAPEVRREFYCEDVIDETRAIVPEFAKVKAIVVREPVLPEWRDVYTVMDTGFHDLTVALFAYWDFARAKIVVEDELSFHGVSGLDVGAAVKSKELTLWGREAKPFRYADMPPQSLADIAHPTLGPGIAFAPVMKDDADAALNALRMAVQRAEIEIAPRCKVLISHLEYGTWNLGRTTFDRVDGFGHWDAIDACKYLVRHVQRRRNPNPWVLPDHMDKFKYGVVQNVDKQQQSLAEAMSARSIRRR